MAVAATLLISQEAGANAIVVTNTYLWNPQIGQQYVYVSVDISWSNSWRTAVNWDAAWVFVKFRAPGSNNWQHAWLSTNSADHIMPAGCTNSAVSDGTGVFIYRTDIATGGVNFAQIKLKWNYGTNGYTFAQGDQIPVCVQAIEMVYVPTGPFYLGSTGSGLDMGHFYQYTDGSQTTNAYYVTSENAITVSSNLNNLVYVNAGGTVGDATGIISNVFPKGYSAFYCMKYEISQGQYVNFLNLLTGAQWTNRDLSSSFGSDRCTIHGAVTNSIADAPDRACDYLGWADGAAYADWAGLRPMTELEYEKACRGFASPVPNEYAWGSTTITQLTAEAGTSGSGTETTGGGTNCCYGNVGSMQGPARCGVFATANSGRVKAGASYWGIMELTGNVWEQTVTVGSVSGRGFQGTHGDGALDVSGNENASSWPGTSASGAGCRGGSWYSSPVVGVSDRGLATRQSNTRYNNYGFRCVRTAP